MQTVNVRELRSAIPHLKETLEREHELVLVSNGEPIARILPVDSRPKIQSLAWLRALAPFQTIDSAELMREARLQRLRR